MFCHSKESFIENKSTFMLRNSSMAKIFPDYLAFFLSLDKDDSYKLVSCSFQDHQSHVDVMGLTLPVEVTSVEMS